jgi:hypothetical protein
MGIDNSTSDRFAIASSADVGSSVRLYLQTDGLVHVPGELTAGTKTFNIEHPNPAMKEQGYRLRHACVESPTTGDNIYRYEVEATENNQIVSINIPDYFRYLNENPQIWVSPANHFGRCYGILNEESLVLEVHCETIGKYNVLLIGTRKDEDAVNNFKGPEYIPEEEGTL